MNCGLVAFRVIHGLKQASARRWAACHCKCWTLCLVHMEASTVEVHLGVAVACKVSCVRGEWWRPSQKFTLWSRVWFEPLEWCVIGFDAPSVSLHCPFSVFSFPLLSNSLYTVGAAIPIPGGNLQYVALRSYHLHPRKDYPALQCRF